MTRGISGCKDWKPSKAENVAGVIVCGIGGAFIAAALVLPLFLAPTPNSQARGLSRELTTSRRINPSPVKQPLLFPEPRQGQSPRLDNRI
jgi:hypothetical protein